MSFQVKHRRNFLRNSTALLATGSIYGCSATRKQLLSMPPVTSTSVQRVPISSRINLFMLQTGWVAVKQTHRAYEGRDELRLASIITSRRWTEWMPITAFLIEHPEGIFVVDTGETTEIYDTDYTSCDAITGFFYRKNLLFSIKKDEEIGPQIAALNFDATNIKTVVITHLHSDHMGGMKSFPNATFLIGEKAISGHAAALMCRLPKNASLQKVVFEQRKAGVFNQTSPLTTDGSLSIVPTPGHANGHQSVLIQDEGVSVCLVGDAAFSMQQILEGGIGGVVENVSDARKSVNALRKQHEQFGTVLLPTHDVGNQKRLQDLCKTNCPGDKRKDA